MALAMNHRATREISLRTATEAQIWRSIRDKDLLKGILGLLMKTFRGLPRGGLLGEYTKQEASATSAEKGNLWGVSS